MTKNTFKNYALIIIATVIISLIAMLPIGILGIVATALLASVIGYTVTKHHYYFVGVVCACVIAISALFSGDFYLTLVVNLPLILSGITLGIAYNLKISEFKTTSIIAGIYTIYTLLNFKFLTQDNKKYFENLLSDSIKNYSDVMASAYPEQFTQAQIQTTLGDALAVMMKFMPSFTIILCALLALLMLYTFKKVLKMTKSDILFLNSFSDWHADRSFSIFFLLIALVSLFLPENNYFSDALANVVLVSVFVFYIFGLSLVDFLLSRKFRSKFARRIILILLITFSSGMPMLIFCFIGTLDGIVNIREKITKNKLPEQE